MLSFFLKSESYKKGILFSTVFNFIAKLLLFIQSVVIAYYFGAHEKTDIYFYSIAFITLMASFVNNLDSTVLIPESMRLYEQNSKQDSISFLNFFICLYIFIALFVTLLLFIEPVKSFLLLSNFNEQVLSENRDILLFSVPLFVLMVLTNLLTSILASYKYFTMPMLAAIINNTMALLFLFLFHETLSITSILIGLLCAYSINICILLYLMKRELKWKFSIVTIKMGKKIFKNVFYAQAGNFVSLISSYIPIYLLSGFNAGIIATLNYGQKTADMPNQLITSQFSSVMGIKLNELFARQDYERVNEVFLSSAKFLLFILIPISAFLFLYNDTLISIFFKRGAFDTASVQLSAEFLKYFGLLLPLLAVNTIVARLFMAGQKIKQAFWYQISLNLITICMLFIGIKYMGTIGYPVTLFIIGSANMLFCYLLLKHYFPFIHYNYVLLYTCKLILLNGILISFIFYVKENVATDNDILQILMGFVIYLSLLMLSNHFLSINKEVVRNIYSVISKKSCNIHTKYRVHRF